MAVISGWLSAIVMLEFAFASFLLFATRGVPWFFRLLGALFALGCGVIFAVFAYYLATDPAKAAVDLKPSKFLFAFVFANIFAFQLIRNLKDRPLEFGCFGAVFRLAGCVVIGWAAFALVVLGTALMIFLVGYLG